MINMLDDLIRLLELELPSNPDLLWIIVELEDIKTQYLRERG